jgi:hypothetical protein
LLTLNYDIFRIEIENDPTYKIGSNNNLFSYDFVYYDKEALTCQSSNHGIKIYKDSEIYKTAIVCAVAGATTIHDKSAVFENNEIYICCADKVFSLFLPDLTLNWVTKVDQFTCFGIYKADSGLFTHGELQVSRLDKKGNIIWENSLRDAILNIGKDNDCFILHDNFIELMDFNSSKYELGFDGRFIEREKNASR